MVVDFVLVAGIATEEQVVVIIEGSLMNLTKFVVEYIIYSTTFFREKEWLTERKKKIVRKDT